MRLDLKYLGDGFNSHYWPLYDWVRFFETLFLPIQINMMNRWVLGWKLWLSIDEKVTTGLPCEESNDPSPTPDTK